VRRLTSKCGGGERAGDPSVGKRRLHRIAAARRGAVLPCAEKRAAKAEAQGRRRETGRRLGRGRDGVGEGAFKGLEWQQYNGNMTVVSSGGRRDGGEAFAPLAVAFV
jgi:hypothetical protein